MEKNNVSKFMKMNTEQLANSGVEMSVDDIVKASELTLKKETKMENEEIEKVTKYVVKNMRSGFIPEKIDDKDILKPVVVIGVTEEESSQILFGGEEEKEMRYFFFVQKGESLYRVPGSDISQFNIKGLDGLTKVKSAKMLDSLLENVPEDNMKKVGEMTSLFHDLSDNFNYEISKEISKYVIENEQSIITELKKIGKLLTSSTSANGSSISIDKINQYAFKKPMMLVGEAGSGKTFSLSSWANKALENGDINHYLQADFHESFEAPDMLGMMVPNSEGTLTWLDGVVTQAFRLASKGEKVVLFADEILRSPQRELSLLIGALIPKSDGMLSIRTNRIMSTGEDGLAVTEEIKCSPSNLWVVAASNVGSQFAVDDMDSAFKDRFRIFKVESDIALATRVVTNIVKDKGFDIKVAVKMLEIFSAFKELKDAGKLQQVFSIRHMSETLKIAENWTEIHSLLEDLSYTVLSINSSGSANKDEANLWKALIAPFDN